MDIWEQIRSVAERSGAAGVGVCTAEPFPEVRLELETRRRTGAHAGLGFTYSHPEVATDIRSSFPWAERLVVVAWSYLPEAGSPGPPEPGTGRIARFATEDHYRGLRRVLDAVATELHGAGHRAEALADDDRLVDRAAAVRAGVGWWGKNAMVLAPGHGPWLLLGSVVTDAELVPTPPMARSCGSCSACLPACPTGALVAPGVLDARRCIARWAQAPGVIPTAFRRAMGDRLYGCDDCLDACPPGLRALAGSDEPRGRVDVVALLAASDAELVSEYAHFYLPKRNARILRRNALVVLGNTAGEEAIPVLAGYLGHPAPVLRLHAAWALGAVGGRRAQAVLDASVPAEPDPEVLAEIGAARAGPDTARPPTGDGKPAGQRLEGTGIL
jgi:epoxyqueuosine reductase